MIQYRTIAAPVSLQPFVRFFWVLESDSGYEHLSMASGCPELIFHYKGSFDELDTNGNAAASFNAGLHAQTAFNRRFITGKSFGILGAFLYPYTVSLLSKKASPEFTNEMPGLADLMGSDGRVLEEKIMLAADNKERLMILCQFLEQRLAGNCPMHLPVIKVIRTMLHSNTKTDLKTLASQAYLSNRQFERKFLSFAGMPAMLFGRICRFQLALAQYGREDSLTSIAYDCGYYDQSHFIRDFREFSGLHPREYFREKNAGNEWRDN